MREKIVDNEDVETIITVHYSTGDIEAMKLYIELEDVNKGNRAANLPTPSRVMVQNLTLLDQQYGVYDPYIEETCVALIKYYNLKVSVDYKAIVSTPALYTGECWRSMEGYKWWVGDFDTNNMEKTSHNDVGGTHILLGANEGDGCQQ
ncbi:hypothetical protein GOBAR_DD20164 [Gossypium barbadense]|nr:hypothetical protein GOBAR_DD20164 [Gossypium barbadense]